MGVGAGAAVGMFDRREALIAKSCVAFALGIALTSLLTAYATLAGVAVTPTLLSLVVVVAVAAGAWRVWSYRGDRRTSRRPGAVVGWMLAAIPACALALYAVVAGRTLATKPLVEWDGWVLWATKARVIYERPDDAAEILRAAHYGAPSYPLGLPALEATTMRAVGSFDSSLVDLQLLVLVLAAVAGMWGLLARVAHPLLIGSALLMPLASPLLAYQLTTNYADVPLAFVMGLGLVAGAAWLASGDERERWQLGCFAVFLGLAAWTKNEGLVLAFAAVLALVAATLVERRGRMQALVAAAVVAAFVAPWRVYASRHGLRTSDYDLASFFDFTFLRERSDRLLPTAEELLSEMAARGSWGASLAVIVLGLVTALLTRSRGVGLYGSLWLLLSFGGLVATYWISNHRLENDLDNSSNRTVVTLVVGGVVLLPLLLRSALTDAYCEARAFLRRRARPLPER